MIQLRAPVTANRRIVPGVSLVQAQAAEIVKRAQAGQFVLARCSDGDDPYLRRAFPLFAIAAPELALLVRADEPGRRWLAHRPAGQPIDLLGPLGRGFTLAGTTRRLLLAAEGMGIAALVALAQRAVSLGVEVTLLAGAPNAATVLPADLLPPEVEYRVATADGSLGERGSVSSLLPAVIQWPDQVCAAGSPALYTSLADAIARHRLLVDADFAHVWQLGPAACGLGACQSCAVETRRGPVLSCREGPVFRLRDLL